jgi:hypothetical protein
MNLLVLADGRTVNLGAKCTAVVAAGDMLRLLTPGMHGVILSIFYFSSGILLFDNLLPRLT